MWGREKKRGFIPDCRAWDRPGEWKTGPCEDWPIRAVCDGWDNECVCKKISRPGRHHTRRGRCHARKKTRDAKTRVEKENAERLTKKLLRPFSMMYNVISMPDIEITTNEIMDFLKENMDFLKENMVTKEELDLKLANFATKDDLLQF